MSKDSLREMLEEQQRINEMRGDNVGSDKDSKKSADAKKNTAVLILFPILMIMFYIFYKAKNSIGIGVCFILMGICVLMLPIVKRSIMLKRCTESVMAVCVHLDARTKRRVTTYAPKWEYTFNGNVYEHQERLHSNIGVPKIGNKYEIFVNPDAPNEIYRKDIKGALFQFMFGAVFVLVGVLTILFK